MTVYELTMTDKEIATHCLPSNGRSRYVPIKGTQLMVRLSDKRIVSQNYDYLTDREVKIACNALKTAVDGRDALSDGERDRKWAITAVQSELEAIGRVGDDNPYLPDSEFWACLIRIASILKGSGRQHLPLSRVKAAIHRETPHLRFKGNRENQINYLFGRAMNQAHPRYRIKGVK